jgi:hypothetical protein
MECGSALCHHPPTGMYYGPCLSTTTQKSDMHACAVWQHMGWGALPLMRPDRQRDGTVSVGACRKACPASRRKA